MSFRTIPSRATLIDYVGQRCGPYEDYANWGNAMSTPLHNPSHALLLASGIAGCALFVAGCASSPDHTQTVAKNHVTFAVTGHGTADITWSGAPGGKGLRTRLPWHTKVNEPVNATPLVLTVVLDQDGGTATCSISLNGHRVGSSLAQGKFGRANCRTAATALQSNE